MYQISILNIRKLLKFYSFSNLSVAQAKAKAIRAKYKQYPELTIKTNFKEL